MQKIEDDFVDDLTEDNQTVLPRLSDYSSNGINPNTIVKVEYIRQNMRMIRILTSENGDPLFQAHMTNRTWRIFKQQYASQKKFSEAEKKLICEYMCGGQLNLYHWYVNHPDTISVHEMDSLLEKLTSKILSLLEEHVHTKQEASAAADASCETVKKLCCCVEISAQRGSSRGQGPPRVR